MTISLGDLAGVAALAVLNVGSGLTCGGGNLSMPHGATAGAAAAGNDSRITGAAQSTNNLSDLANSVAARTNLGLGAWGVRDRPQSLRIRRAGRGAAGGNRGNSVR